MYPCLSPFGVHKDRAVTLMKQSDPLEARVLRLIKMLIKGFILTVNV